MHPRPRHPRRSMVRIRRPSTVVAAAFAAVLAVASPAGAQELPPDTVPVPQARGVSPRGAFVRAVLVPGWGHAAIGSYHRGAFYFVVEGAAAWTLLKTRRRYDEAGSRARFREDLLRSDLAVIGVTDPDDIRQQLDADPVLQDLNALVESRRQQREDWTAVGIFLLFLSGVDAFVSAHLQDFPTPLNFSAEPVGNGRVDFSVGFTLPR